MSSGHTILVVDDEICSITICRALLEKEEEYTVYTASSGAEAVQLLKKRAVDLLITDVEMPNMSGIELIIEAQKISNDFLALVITGSADIDIAVAALHAGCFGFMEKPITAGVLMAQTARALDHLDLTRDLAIEKERNLRQNLLAHSGRMAALGEMASSLAHEINQPLNIMSIIVQGWELLASRNRLEMDKVLAEVGNIRNNIERITTLIDHVRCLGRQESEMAQISPSKVLTRALDLCKVQFKSHAIDLLEDIAPDIPAIWGVANELEQVIINLLANARHAVTVQQDKDKNFKGKIEIRADSGVNVKIVITDNGGGMPAGVARQVFEPFFSTKPVGEGTGLGLSISREIVEKFNGTITLENHPGSGAKFILTFPIEQNYAYN